MKISELVNILENIKEEEGDIEVVIQYRDSGGLYEGYDDDVSPYIDYNLKKVFI